MGKGRGTLSKDNAASRQGQIVHMQKRYEQEAAELVSGTLLAHTELEMTLRGERRPRKNPPQPRPRNDADDDDNVSAQHDPDDVLEHDPDAIRASSSSSSSTRWAMPRRSFPRGTTKLLKKIPWNDTDATLCVICQGPVERADVLWVGTDCRPHVHLYHAPCLAHWWLHSLSRNCPRCTQRVDRFVVRARLPDERVGWRLYRAVPGSHRRVVFEKFGLVSQAWGLKRALNARGMPSALEWLPMPRKQEQKPERGNFAAAIVDWTARLWDGEDDELSREGRRICRRLQRDEMRCTVHLHRVEAGR